jgi:hypothetical protein
MVMLSRFADEALNVSADVPRTNSINDKLRNLRRDSPGFTRDGGKSGRAT